MATLPAILIVRPTDATFMKAAHALAERLSETLAPSWWDEWPGSPANAVALTWFDGALTAVDLSVPRTTGVRVDFAGALRRRPSKNDPLLRAIGSARSVIDVTAGYCDDAMRLVAAGLDVTAYERHPLVAALVEDAIARFHAGASREAHQVTLVPPRFDFRGVDARSQLTGRVADAIYIDPMYPPKRRSSALPRKEIQLLHCLLGPTDDHEALFEAATRAQAQRWIVKRPIGARPLGVAIGWKPANQIQSKLVRFDLYTR